MSEKKVNKFIHLSLVINIYSFNMQNSIIQSLIHGLDGYNSYLAPKKALEGLTVEVAGKKIPGAPHTIWQILGHLNFWQEYFMAYISGKKFPRVMKAADGWPEQEHPRNQEELNHSISYLLESIEQTKQLLVEGNDLPHPSNYDSGYDVVTSMATHIAYHTGQIVIMRRILGDYPPPSGGYTW